mmetsp:Transcript_24574/g.46744  ORF Transcript_24574/g.46744 Transcript_24574/m.46744 type:complete len:240 (+) Transcript_24574:1016-1735(+)
MFTAGEGSENHGPSSKDKTEASKVKLFDRHALQVRQVTQRGKHCKTRDEGKKRVGAGDDKRVQGHRTVAVVVGAKGSHDTERDTNREENLRNCRRPDIWTFCENLHVPTTNVFLDSKISAFESNRREQKDEKQHNGDSHGQVCDSSGPLGSTRQTGPNQEPSNSRVADIGPHHAGGTPVVAEGGSTYELINEVINGFAASDSVVCPRVPPAKGIKECVDDPGNQHGVIGNQNECARDGA